MKNIKFLKALLVFILGLSTFLTRIDSAFAAESFQMNVIIHKLQADSYNSNLPIVNENGEQIADTSSLGTNVKPLSGVEFTAYTVDKSTYDQAITGTFPTQPESGGELLGVTGDDGTVSWTVDVDPASPKYFIVFETSKPNSVTDSLAVPFAIAFPMTKSDGSEYLKDIHIYPKNITGAFPVIGKDIANLGQNRASFNVGESFKYILKGTIPTNIEKYTKYTFTDELDPALTFDSNVSPTIKVGTETLNINEHFKYTSSGQTITIDLTDDGITKIASQVSLENRNKISANDIGDISSNTNSAPFIEVSFNTYMNGTNSSANTEITNNASVTYNNSVVQETTSASDTVSIVYGSQKFKKVDPNGGALSEAVFTVLEDNNPVLWNESLINLNQATNNDNFLDVEVDKPIKLKSNTDGSFTINGLAYSNQGNDGATPSQYSVKEVKAPEGYQLLANPVDFTVVSSNNLQTITNHLRPSIPATGGIGTIIFILAGLSLMFFAIVGRRKTKEEA